MVIQAQKEMGQQMCFCAPVQHAFAVTAPRLAFHEATERFGWLIGSQQGSWPINLQIRRCEYTVHGCRTHKYPQQSCGCLIPPQKAQDSAKSAKFYQNFGKSQY
jgi:hypothetical protein